MAQLTRPPRVPSPPSRSVDEWLQGHAGELAQSRKPAFHSSRGLPVEPLYTPDSLQKEGWDYQRDVG